MLSGRAMLRLPPIVCLAFAAPSCIGVKVGLWSLEDRVGLLILRKSGGKNGQDRRLMSSINIVVCIPYLWSGSPLCAMIKTCYLRRLLHLTHCLLFAGKRLCSLPCALLITIRNDGYSRVLAVDDDGPCDLNIECSELPYPVTSFASIMKRFVVRLNLLLKNRYALNCEIATLRV